MKFVDKINLLFNELYLCEDIDTATEKSKEILDKLSEKGLVNFDEPLEKDVHRLSFNEYLSTFGQNPNPNLSKIETIRMIVRQSFRYED